MTTICLYAETQDNLADYPLILQADPSIVCSIQPLPKPKLAMTLCSSFVETCSPSAIVNVVLILREPIVAAWRMAHTETLYCVNDPFHT